MQGRQNKNLIIRLKSNKKKTSFFLVVQKKRSQPRSNLDNIGKLTLNSKDSFLKIDLKKLNFYLYKGINLSVPVAKIFGAEDTILSNILIKKKINTLHKNNITQRIIITNIIIKKLLIELKKKNIIYKYKLKKWFSNINIEPVKINTSIKNIDYNLLPIVNHILKNLGYNYTQIIKEFIKKKTKINNII